MPCGCETPKYAMRFVGWKDGKLIKGAPSLPQGWIQENFIEEATLPHWELVEPAPETKKAPSSDSEDSVYVEDETPEEVVEETVVDPEELVDEIDLMNVKDLKLFIEERGGTVDSNWLKADLVREARELEEALRSDSVEPEADEHGDPAPEEPEEES